VAHDVVRAVCVKYQ